MSGPGTQNGQQVFHAGHFRSEGVWRHLDMTPLGHAETLASTCDHVSLPKGDRDSHGWNQTQEAESQNL